MTLEFFLSQEFVGAASESASKLNADVEGYRFAIVGNLSYHCTIFSSQSMCHSDRIILAPSHLASFRHSLPHVSESAPPLIRRSRATPTRSSKRPSARTACTAPTMALCTWPSRHATSTCPRTGMQCAENTCTREFLFLVEYVFLFQL